MDLFGIKHNYYKRKTHQQRLGNGGLTFLKSLKNKDEGEVFTFEVAGYSESISLRNKTSDIPTFYQCIFDAEYKIDFGFTPTVIIDLGANIGLTSLYFNKEYPSAQIIAVEPEASNYNLLKKNFGLIENIKPIQAAIWHEDGEIVLMDEGFGHYGYTVYETDDERVGTSVKSISLNTIIQQYQMNSIDVLKIDIEGAEKELFTGDISVWMDMTKVLIIELHDRMRPGCSKAVFDALSPYSYEMKIKGENLVFFFDH